MVAGLIMSPLNNIQGVTVRITTIVATSIFGDVAETKCPVETATWNSKTKTSREYANLDPSSSSPT